MAGQQPGAAATPGDAPPPCRDDDVAYSAWAREALAVGGDGVTTVNITAIGESRCPPRGLSGQLGSLWPCIAAGAEAMVRQRWDTREQRQPHVVGAALRELRRGRWDHTVLGLSPIVTEVIYDPEPGSPAHVQTYVLPGAWQCEARTIAKWTPPDEWGQELGRRAHKALRNQARQHIAACFTQYLGDFSYCLPARG